MTLLQAQKNMRDRLGTIYEIREAGNIADWVIEHYTGWTKTTRVMNRHETLPGPMLELFESATNELLTYKPVQYVLGQTWFNGLTLYVNESVLIPRPETEELVEWIAACHDAGFSGTILDVGTGSGAIPVALQKKFVGATIHACDISHAALNVAQINSREHKTEIHFHELDFLDHSNWSRLPKTDMLVSNPPYVPLNDKAAMADNVVQYEPHLALFVPDNDPLIFYNALADFALKHMQTGGAIYAEIHEDLANSVQELFQAKGFTDITVKKDMQGKDRMVKVLLP